MKRNVMRFTTFFSIILILTLVLTACAKPVVKTEAPVGSSAETQAPATTEKTKLIIWVHAAEPFTNAHGKIAELYMAQNPNVEIEIQSFPWSDYPAKLTSSLAADTGPDLIEAYSPWMMAYIRTGKVDPVPESFITSEDMVNTYYESTLALLGYDGKYYGVPSNISLDATRVLLVNDAIVEEAGVDITENKTIEDWISDWQALTVTDSEGQITRSGLGVTCSDPPYQFTSYIMEYGGSVLTEDGKKAALNSEAGKKALQFMSDILNVYKIDNSLISDSVCVGNGLAASSYRGTWFYPVLKADYPDFTGSYHVLPLPPGATVDVFHGGSGWASYVPANSANKDAAWDYLKFVEANRESWLIGTGETSANKVLAEKMAKENPALYEAYYSVLEQSKHGFAYGDFFVIWDAMQAMYTSVALGTATVDEALATAESTINTHLDQWWAQFDN
jgi:ABC-type glycerol-3-phosphate transport system substrate-binding protein